MIDNVRVIGAHGRVGSAVVARLVERGIALEPDEPALIVLCVPDREIPGVAARLEVGPWVAHVSGATPLAALDPHAKRLSMHPLQTVTHRRGAEQLDGAWAAVSADDNDGIAVGTWLAETLGLRPFVLPDEGRAAYHAGAVIASNYLVTLRRAAGRLLERAGAPPEALDPLMRRVIENDFELTGPIERGDWETVRRNQTAIAATAPELLEAYDALAALTAATPVATAGGSRPPGVLA